jgi:hypothetical protein
MLRSCAATGAFLVVLLFVGTRIVESPGLFSSGSLTLCIASCVQGSFVKGAVVAADILLRCSTVVFWVLAIVLGIIALFFLTAICMNVGGSLCVIVFQALEKLYQHWHLDRSLYAASLLSQSHKLTTPLGHLP